jgi:proton glutamate symport protein
MNLNQILKLAVPALIAIFGLHFLQFFHIADISTSGLLTSRILSACLIAAVAWRHNTLSGWILAALPIGAIIGFDFPSIATNLDIFSKIFIQLIKTVIAPLLFGTLVIGIAGHSNMKQVGRMGLKAFIYFELATTIALFVGLVAINITGAGRGIHVPEKNEVAKMNIPISDLNAVVDSNKGTYKLTLNEKDLIAETPAIKQDWKKIILHTFPENVAKMIYEGAVLQVVIFSLLFGFGLSQVSDKHRKPMLGWIESLTEVMFKFTGFIMYLAPFAVGGSIAFTIGTMGLGVVGNLLALLGTLYGALIVFMLLVFVPVLWICRVSIKRFFQAVYEPASLAFATASSEAALPKAMAAMEAFGVPRKIVSFVIPTGYSFNLDGSTLYLALASVFCAQAAGMELSWGTQVLICLTLMLTSKGVAGIPRASLVILAATVAQFGIPEWPIAIILGIDALMDMGRTGVNLIGNCLASVVVAKWEGELNMDDQNNLPQTQ